MPTIKQAKTTGTIIAVFLLAGVLALAGKLCPALPGALGAHTGDILMIAAFVVNAAILAAGKLHTK